MPQIFDEYSANLKNWIIYKNKNPSQKQGAVLIKSYGN
jgi:hypothetical protein